MRREGWQEHFANSNARYPLNTFEMSSKFPDDGVRMAGLYVPKLDEEREIEYRSEVRLCGIRH